MIETCLNKRRTRERSHGWKLRRTDLKETLRRWQAQTLFRSKLARRKALTHESGEGFFAIKVAPRS